MTVVDLFAGPGGWSRALALLGLGPEVAYDWDRSVALTRKAAGLHLIQGDVAAQAPPPGPWAGLVASPPCPLFSNAGNRVGLQARDLIAAAVAAVLDGDTAAIADARRRIAEKLEPQIADEHPEWTDGVLAFDGLDSRAYAEADRIAAEACLCLEPARWIHAGQPRWIALEQVPQVAPIWDVYAAEFDARGYSTWSGILEAADYGVPQTRQRAILIASRDRVVGRPPATHAKDGADGLAPWVTMAEALPHVAERLGLTARVGFPRLDDKGDSPDGYRTRDTRPLDQPAFALTEKARSWTVNTGRDWKPGGTSAKAGGQWRLEPVYGDYPKGTARSCEEPAPTIVPGKTAGGLYQWVADRPATTIAGDPRVFSPGGHIANDGRDNSKMVGRSENAIRVELADALTLQTFPPDWPVKGNRTEQFRQVGNAFPPLAAVHVLAEAAGMSPLTPEP